MSFEPKDYSIHLVGLGGTGANIIEELLKNPGIFGFLKRSGVKISCLAIDVADHDIQSLTKTYRRFVAELKLRGIPSEKVSFTAKTVKFPTPEAMFEFLEKFPSFLKHEGAKVQENYKPWLSSATDIPPLSGGVGRRRALSKAIYGLNYYLLKLVDGYAENFKESISSATLQPIIYVIFGIGGGTGSGLAVDFVRHLRQKLGSGFPIVGFGILPCPGDDPAAKGASAYACLDELELLLDKNKNETVMKTFGQVYENPFTAFIMMPLGPPYSKTGNLPEAKGNIDESIVDIIMNSMRFDLSDILNNISANLYLGEKWIHTITSIRVSYPIDDSMALVKLDLNKLDVIRMLRKEKLEICGGSLITKTGGINKVLLNIKGELANVYRSIIRDKGIYDEKNFQNQLTNYIYEDHSVEMLFNMQLKGSEDSIRRLITELLTPIRSIVLDAPEGTPEARVRKLVQEIVDIIEGIESLHPKFHAFVERITDDMNTSIRSAQKLTFRQKLLLNDLLELVLLLDSYLLNLRSYFEVRTIADKLQKELFKAEKTENQQLTLRTVQHIINPELTVIFSLLPEITTSPQAELKAIDSVLSGIRILKRDLTEQVDRAKVNLESIQAKLKTLKNEQESIVNELKSIKVPMFHAGKKRYLDDQKSEIEHKISTTEMELEDADSAIKMLESKLSEYSSMERKFDVNSEYRKLLGQITEIENTVYEKMNQISRDRGYYDRVAEIAEDERLRIMQKILKEEEASLTRENILREIVDRKRFKDYLVSVMRILRIPSTLGVTSHYRTDYMWATIVAPRGVWDKDLDFELKATLSGYISGDVSRCITIREIESVDPWTIRFLIIASKATKQDLDVYRDMKALYDQSSESNVLLAHSFLLEQGVIVTEDFLKSIGQTTKESQ